MLAAMRVGRGYGTSGEPTGTGSSEVSQGRPPGRLRRWWARIHRRSPRDGPTVVRADEALPERAAGRPSEAADCELLTGGYITDGETLFRVEHIHSDPRSGEMFVELEDCTTLELSVWSVDHLCARPVRCVVPVHAPEHREATYA